MFDSFGGIRIYVYDFDHPPPHFHAISAEFEAQISIETLEILRGEMPPGKLKKIRRWARQNQASLLLEFEILNPHLKR